MDPSLSVPLRLHHTSAPQLTPHAEVLDSIRHFLSDYAVRTGSSAAPGGAADDAAAGGEASGSGVLSSQLSRLATGLDPNSANVMAIFDQFENIGNGLSASAEGLDAEEATQEMAVDEQPQDTQDSIAPTLDDEGDDDEQERKRKKKEDKEEKKRRKEEKKKKKDSEA